MAGGRSGDGIEADRCSSRRRLGGTAAFDRRGRLGDPYSVIWPVGRGGCFVGSGRGWRRARQMAAVRPMFFDRNGCLYLLPHRLDKMAMRGLLMLRTDRVNAAHDGRSLSEYSTACNRHWRRCRSPLVWKAWGKKRRRRAGRLTPRMRRKVCSMATAGECRRCCRR